MRVESNLKLLKDDSLLLKQILNKTIELGGKALSFLVTSSLFVSTTLFFVVYFTFSSIDTSPNYPLFIASFLVTFSIYNLNKLTDVEEDKVNVPERMRLITKKNYLILLLSTLAYVAALIIGVFSGEILALVFLLIPLWIAILYSVRFSPHLPRLKDIFLVKSISVTTGWVLSILILSYLFYPHIGIILFWLYFLFIKLFINSILFDVRDVEGDKVLGVKTIPVVWGLKKTRIFLFCLNSLLLPWVGFVAYFGLFQVVFPLLLFAIFYSYWYIARFCRTGKKHSLIYDIVVDGEWILLGSVVLFFQYVIQYS